MLLSRLFVWVFCLASVFSLVASSYVAVGTPVLQIKITTDDAVYNVSDSANINANITLDGNPAANVAAIEIVSPYGNPYIIRTIKTGNVSQMYARVQFVDLYMSASDGTPRTLCNPGDIAYIKVTIKNIDVVDRVVLIGLYAQGSDNTPLYAYFPTNGTLGAGHVLTYLLPFPIPTNAPRGQSSLFGSLFTDYPANRGYAYCPEQAANFSVSASTPKMPQQPEYSNMTFNLPKKNVKLGNYTIYAATNLNVFQTSTDTEQFTVVLLGDINKDYVINMRDIAAEIVLFQTTPSSPNWNPDADIDKDGVVNMRDIAALVQFFGNSAMP